MDLTILNTEASLFSNLVTSLRPPLVSSTAAFSLLYKKKLTSQYNSLTITQSRHLFRFLAIFTDGLNSKRPLARVQELSEDLPALAIALDSLQSTNSISCAIMTHGKSRNITAYFRRETAS
jgi:hypothetical protein